MSIVPIKSIVSTAFVHEMGKAALKQQGIDVFSWEASEGYRMGMERRTGKPVKRYLTIFFNVPPQPLKKLSERLEKPPTQKYHGFFITIPLS